MQLKTNTDKTIATRELLERNKYFCLTSFLLKNEGKHLVELLSSSIYTGARGSGCEKLSIAQCPTMTTPFYQHTGHKRTHTHTYIYIYIGVHG